MDECHGLSVGYWTREQGLRSEGSSTASCFTAVPYAHVHQGHLRTDVVPIRSKYRRTVEHLSWWHLNLLATVCCRNAPVWDAQTWDKQDAFQAGLRACPGGNAPLHNKYTIQILHRNTERNAGTGGLFAGPVACMCSSWLLGSCSSVRGGHVRAGESGRIQTALLAEGAQCISFCR